MKRFPFPITLAELRTRLKARGLRGLTHNTGHPKASPANATDSIELRIREIARAEVERALAAAKPAKDLLVREAAELCGVTANTVYRWVAKGTLNAYRRGRRVLIRPIDLERMLTDTKSDPKSVAQAMYSQMKRKRT